MTFQMQPGSGKLRAGPNVVQTAANNFNVSLPNGEVIPLGQSTSSFTPKMVFPRWQAYAWNASIGLSMAVPANALAIAGMTSSNTANSVTASNSYFGITYSGVDVKPGFNEGGGLDINITLKRSIGNTLAFSFNNVNTKAFLQPSLTLEWTVGQDLGNGVTVASVTDTDVTGTDGLVHVHRPDYVVNAIAFYHATQGGLVSDVQAATGLTTGQIGMLYRMKVTDSSATPKTGWANWSIQNANTLWLNFDTTGMTYPIQIIPVGDVFGYQTAGGTAYSCNTAYIHCWITGFTGAAGTGTSMSASISDGVGSYYVTMALYDGSTPSNLISNGTTGTVKSAWNQNWKTSNFGVSPTLSAVTYRLAIGSNNNAVQIYGNSGGAGTGKYISWTYPTFPSSGTWASLSSLEYSIYFTYTTGGGATTYPVTINESSVSVSDSIAKVQSFVKAISESSLSVSDEILKMQENVKIISEASIAVSDSSARAPVRSTSISESAVSVSDSTSKVLTRIKAISESAISISDSILTLTSHIIAITESAISVSSSAVVNTIHVTSKAILESAISVSDGIVKLYQAKINVGESSISVSDGIVKMISYSRLIGESVISVSDGIAKVHQFTTIVSEAAVSVSDATVKLYQGIRAISESSISISDAISNISQRAKTLSEAAISVSDSLIYLCWRVIAAAESAISVSDSVAAIKVSGSLVIRTISEAAVNVNDAIVAGMVRVKSMAESVGSTVKTIGASFRI